MYGGVTNVSPGPQIAPATGVGAALALNWVSSPAAGSTALLFIVRSTSNTISSITDNGGGGSATWVRDVTVSNGTIACDIWRANGLGAGATAVTVNNSGTRIGFWARAYTGVRPGPPSSNLTNNGLGTAQTVTGTPAGAGALYFGGVGNQTLSGAETQINFNSLFSFQVVSAATGNGWGAVALDTVDSANTAITRTLGMTTGDSVAWIALSATYESSPPVPPNSLITALPQWLAGFDYRDTDMMASWAQVAAMMQHNVVFRAAQTQTASTLLSTGAFVGIYLDTVFEDPFGGYNNNPANPAWSPPLGMTGWFSITWTVCTVAPPAATTYMLEASIGSPLGFADECIRALKPSQPGQASGSWVFPMIGPSLQCGFLAALWGAAANLSTSLVAGQQSHMEISWWTIQ